jgi:hypothetical protein
MTGATLLVGFMGFALQEAPAPVAPPLRYAKPRLLVAGFCSEPRVPLVADLDGDGFGDLIAVDLAAGLADVARSVRGGKFLGPVNAANSLGAMQRATTRAGAKGRAELVLETADGARKIVAFGDDGAWSVRDEPPEPAAAAASSTASSASPSSSAGLEAAPPPPLPPELLAAIPAGALTTVGDVNGDKLPDVVAFRRDDAWRIGRDVLAYVAYHDGDPDPDGDGLDAATEARWKSDPLDSDSDHDGLLDGWEAKGEGDLDLPALGASPAHADCFVYVQRYSETDGATCAREMDRVVKTWDALPNANPDGATGIRLHPIWLPPFAPCTPGRAWWDLGNENLPKRARGLAHYMEINVGGGGQAAELGDMGGCGQGAFWACFLHEFGHQVGLSHAGGPLWGMCPTYTSLMSYAYSYGFNDDGNQIHYSRGEFADLTLNETKLVERLPFPFEKVAFLAKGPYRFKLAADGDATKVDWNRDGVFDEGIVRADIDDVYGVGATRFGAGKTRFAPVLVDHGGKLLLFGVTRDGRLYVRSIDGVSQTGPELYLDQIAPSGDAAAIDDGTELTLLVPTAEGIATVTAADVAALAAAEPKLLADSKGLAVSAALHQGRVVAILWKDATTPVTFVRREENGTWSAARPLTGLVSSFPPGAAEDPATHELVAVVGAKRGAPGHEHDAWVATRLRANAAGEFEVAGARTVGGDASGWYGNSRPVVLFESGPTAVAQGRMHVVSKGFAGPPNFNCCVYEAITIGDASMNEGWRLRRYCDEWSTTRSPAAACFHANDMAVGYRWFGNVHGDEDDDVHLMLDGFGIIDRDMHDFDDVKEIAEIGLARSIPWRDPAAR